MPWWRLEKPMGATPLRARGAPNSRRHGVHAKRERATLPASLSGGIGWEAGGAARSWNDPDASGSPRVAHFSGWSPKGGYSLGRLPDGQGEPPDNPHVAQRTEWPPPKRQVAGSNPAVGTISCNKRPLFRGKPAKNGPLFTENAIPHQFEPLHRWQLSARFQPMRLACMHAPRPPQLPSVPWLRGKRKATPSAKTWEWLPTKGGQQ